MENFYRRYNGTIIVTDSHQRDISVFDMFVRDMLSALKRETEKRRMTLIAYKHPYAVTGYFERMGHSVYFAWTCPPEGHPVNLDECSAMNGFMYRIHSIKEYPYLNTGDRFSSWRHFMDNVDDLLNESAVVAELSKQDAV